MIFRSGDEYYNIHDFSVVEVYQMNYKNNNSYMTVKTGNGFEDILMKEFLSEWKKIEKPDSKADEKDKTIGKLLDLLNKNYKYNAKGQTK